MLGWRFQVYHEAETVATDLLTLSDESAAGYALNHANRKPLDRAPVPSRQKLL